MVSMFKKLNESKMVKNKPNPVFDMLPQGPKLNLKYGRIMNEMRISAVMITTGFLKKSLMSLINNFLIISHNYIFL
jgi:hypothetical protein